MKTLDELVVEKVESFETDLLKAVKPVIAAKQYGVEDTIAKLVVDAVALVMKNGSFNVDNIRVVKVMGASLSQSQVVKGMVFPREPEGTVKTPPNPKLSCLPTPSIFPPPKPKVQCSSTMPRKCLISPRAKNNSWTSCARKSTIQGLRWLLLVLVWASWRYITSTSTASWC